eukprot:m.215408 g.215408  ORF g.215408 m.215408 type:complete len:417 (-) comp25615_c0_seq4:351-1601(-)
MSIYGGMVLALVGSTGESLGLTLQKLSHDRELARSTTEGDAPVFYLKQKMWWVGIVVFALGNILDFIALGLTGASVVIVVGCWALAVNLYTAPKILKEKRSLIDLIAGAMIVVGISMAVGALLASGREDPGWTAEELVDRFIDPLVLILLSIVIVLAIGTYISTRMYAKKYPHLHKALTHTGQETEEETAQRETARVAAGEKEELAISDSIRYQHVLLAAMIGTLTVVTAKATSEILIQTIAGENEFKGFAIVIVALFIFSLPAQLHFINVSLMINDALFHIPVFYVFWQVGVTIVGGVLYKEFVGFEIWHWVLYVIGVLILFAGIKVASKRLAAVEHAMRADILSPTIESGNPTSPSTTAKGVTPAETSFAAGSFSPSRHQLSDELSGGNDGFTEKVWFDNERKVEHRQHTNEFA